MKNNSFFSNGWMPLAGVALTVMLLCSSTAFGTVPGGSLAPGDVPKFAVPLVIPPAMPADNYTNMNDVYKIAVRQFDQQIISGPYPETTVWSYGSVNNPGTFNYPAFTIEASWNKKVTVEWYNELVDAQGNYLPHLLPVDPTLHWANPPGGMKARDTRPSYTVTPGPYTGPVPIVTHVHGAHVTEESDGYPEAWYLPDAKDIPKGFATTGTFYDYYKKGQNWKPGMAMFQYQNDQRATTLWYHDHTLGMTRINVYAGPAGFYLIRGGPDDVVLDSRYGTDAILPGPTPGVGDSPLGNYGEIPIVVQDRSFNTDGSLFFPDTREFFDEYTGPFNPDSPISPIWNPEFFGNMMVVNGKTWPFLVVEKKRYRLRMLNGCNARFLILQFDHPGVKVWQIGADGGFLPAPILLNDYPYPGSQNPPGVAGGATLLLALAERADLIVDFSGVPDNGGGDYTSVKMLNLGPDEPFGGGAIGDSNNEGEFDPSDPADTGLVMEFRVSNGSVADPTTPPEYLELPAYASVGTANNTRQLSLNEVAYEVADYFGPGVDFEGPEAALLGTYDPGTGESDPMLWMDPITENPNVGDVEEWVIYNLTADAHPIHIHLVQFEVLGRGVIGDPSGTSIAGSNDPLPWETGPKDTVISYPGEITRVKMRFDTPGFYVWHCHIIDHEDNEMMRPYHVGPIPKGAPAI